MKRWIFSCLTRHTLSIAWLLPLLGFGFQMTRNKPRRGKIFGLFYAKAPTHIIYEEGKNVVGDTVLEVLDECEEMCADLQLHKTKRSHWFHLRGVCCTPKTDRSPQQMIFDSIITKSESIFQGVLTPYV